MGTVSIFILLFGFLSNFSKVNTQSNEAKSDLQQVADELRILARVTNAIDLHFAVMHKEIKIDSMMAEVFRIPVDELHEIIDMEVTETFAEIKRMHEVHKVYVKNHNDERNRQDTSKGVVDNWIKTDEMLVGKHIMSFFSELPEKNSTFNDASNVNSDELLKKAKDLQNNPIFNNDCFKVDADNLNAFRLLFKENPENYKVPNEQEIMKIFQDFVKQTSLFLSCSKNIDQTLKELKKLEILKSDKTYENVRKSKQIAMEYASMYSIGIDTSKTLIKLKENFKNSSAIWNGSGKSNFEKHRGIVSLLNSTFRFSKYTREKDPIELLYTPGFRNSEDLLKVADDLKSSWFKKNVARGASTKKLEMALEPYHNISNMIISLDETWKTLKTFSVNENNDMIERADRIREIAVFSNMYDDMFKLLDKYEAIFKKCLNLGNQNFQEKSFTKFETEQQPAENVVNQVREVKHRMEKIEKTFGRSFDGISNIASIDTVVSFLNTSATQIIDSNQASKGTQDVTKEVNNMKTLLKMFFKTSSVFDLFKLVAQLKTEMTLLKQLSENVTTTTTTIKIQDILDQLEIKNVAKCFNDTKTDLVTVASLFDIISLIYNFPGETSIGNLLKYMENIGKIIHGISTIPKVMAQIHSKRSNKLKNLIQPLNNSRALSENFGGSIEVLERLEIARGARNTLLNVPQFSGSVARILYNEGLKDWSNPKPRIEKIIKDADNLNTLAGKVKDQDLNEITKIFEEAVKIEGLDGKPSQLENIYKVIDYNVNRNKEATIELAYLKQIPDFDLDFARHHSHLANARVTYNSLKTYFDEIFGHTVHPKHTVLVEKQIPVSYTIIICAGIGVILLMIIVILTIYGLTEKGRENYKILYIYYFGNQKHFEKRWRYSLFADTVDGKNALLDSVREGNKPNLLNALKNGAFIDAYNKFGNTALHVAVKFAQPDLVELLIKYGIDRNLLNSKNLSAIQMIPYEYKKKYPDRVGKYEKIRKIWDKYSNKTYRVSVPRTFPSSSFHIWPDESTDVKLTNQFLEAFRAISSDEAIPTTTHVVFKTDKKGILETDSLDSLFWIFHGSIIVKEQWMTDCLKNEALIKKDMDYLIEKVKYKEHVYDTVLQWSEAMAKGQMPYLYGVFVVVVAKEYKNLMTLSNIVTEHGGVMMNTFPYKEHFDMKSHPYLHANLGPLFVIHDETDDVSQLKNDPDKMYTCFTEEQFVNFMLKREINSDTRFNPPNVLLAEEEN